MGTFEEKIEFFDPNMMEDRVGPVVIQPGGDETADPIFYSKACRQLGVPSQAQPFKDDKGNESVRARLPIMPKVTFENIVKRAEFLLEREQKGLPTEQLPSGRWPDSLDEFADQILVTIAKSAKKNSIYIDFGRPIQAIGVNPAMARSIAVMLMNEADCLDPLMESIGRPELINVARIKVSDSEAEKEGRLEFPSLLKKEEEQDE